MSHSNSEISGRHPVQAEAERQFVVHRQEGMARKAMESTSAVATRIVVHLASQGKSATTLEEAYLSAHAENRRRPSGLSKPSP